MIALLIWAVGWLEIWEAKTWDLARVISGKTRKNYRRHPLDFLLDQKSLDWAAEEWGLPGLAQGSVRPSRQLCRRNKVKVLAFDVLFQMSFLNTALKMTPL